jgi:hypothetical protein
VQIPPTQGSFAGWANYLTNPHTPGTSLELPFPTGVNLPLGVSDSLTLASFGLSAGLPLQVDYNAAVQRRFLEEQERRGLVEQAFLLRGVHHGGLSRPTSASSRLVEARLAEELRLRGGFARQLLGANNERKSKGPLRKRKMSSDPVYIVTKRTESEATFPLPRTGGKAYTASVGSLTTFKKTWKDLENKTAGLQGKADKEAFVAELFARALHGSKPVALANKATGRTK